MANTILITGASTGIGKATAELFLEQGWNVIATMRTPKDEQAHERKLVTRLDVLEQGSIDEAIRLGIEKFGRIDALVNNAGYGLVGTFESMSEGQIKRQFDTNVFGLMRLTNAILPHFRANKAGILINVASMGGRLTFPFYSVYHGTKWAVDGFSESLSYELGEIGARVKIIEPGAIKTDFYGRSADFTHDTELSEYNGIVEKGMRRMNAAGAKGAPASAVADAIWKAATDGSGRLRYVVGSDAKMMLGLRKLIGVRAFMATIRSQLFK